LDANDCSTYYVFLRCKVSAPLAEEEITIFANGDRVWRGALGEEPKDLCLKVFRKNDQGSWWALKIGLWAPDRSELYDSLVELDGRAPAIGLSRLVVVPEDDLQTRLDILQNRVIN
jgi:hypothetical protein